MKTLSEWISCLRASDDYQSFSSGVAATFRILRKGIEYFAIPIGLMTIIVTGMIAKLFYDDDSIFISIMYWAGCITVWADLFRAREDGAIIESYDNILDITYSAYDLLKQENHVLENHIKILEGKLQCASDEILRLKS